MKKLSTNLPLFLALISLVVSGCVALPNPTRGPEAEPTRQSTEVSQPEPADPLSLCPAATAALQRLVVAEGRYCLAYPAQYKVEKPTAGETLLVIGGLLDASNPRVQIRVTDAGGASAESAASTVAAGFKDFPLDRSVRTVAAEPAVVLDKVPGQDISRRVLFVHDGLLYDLTFAPADPAVGDAYTRMLELQEQVLASLTFLPAGFAVDNDCLEPTGETQLHMDRTRGFCLLYPAGYTAKQTAPNEAAFYSGSLQDVSQPKFFVRVDDANGQTAQDIAGAAVAEVQASVPGHQVDRPFGVTLGYEAAERIDNLPGQDIGRILIVVHGPRSYRLTFVPADPTDAGMFQKTEALYDLVLRSFRFLN